jgi:hypothetical protein
MSRLSLVLLATLIVVPALFTQEQPAKEERFSGVAMATGGSLGGKTLNFDFRVTNYASDAEVEQLAALLKQKGQDALRSAMEKLNAGRINPVMTTGTQIAIARKKQVGPDTVITIITARTMSFAELYRSSRSTDYPFGFLQVKLNAKGEGTGQIMAAAKLRFDKKKGHYEIESYGNQYIKAVNVRPMK